MSEDVSQLTSRDISLIVLTRTVSFIQLVQPLGLVLGRKILAVGWGAGGGEVVGNRRQMIPLPQTLKGINKVKKYNNFFLRILYKIKLKATIYAFFRLKICVLD